MSLQRSSAPNSPRKRVHPEAREAVGDMVRQAFDAGANTSEWRAGLDLGGQTVNGGARDKLPCERWTVVDVVESEGVDLVADARTWIPTRRWYDVVLCTEVLEHLRWWPLLIRTAAEALRGGGYLFLTCASDPRPRHGAQGGPLPVPNEWYENVDPAELKACAELFFEDVWVAYRERPGDAYLSARR